MHHRNTPPIVIALVLAIGGMGSWAVGAAPPTDPLDKAFAELAGQSWDAGPEAQAAIEQAIRTSHGNAAARGPLETRLAAVLSSKGSRPAKDFVCRALAEMGTARSVPVLAALLADPELSHMARFALERIPDPAAGAALREALPKVPAKLKAGLIDSLGSRRDAASVPAIAPLLKDPDGAVAQAAILALARIDPPEAARTLAELAATAPKELRPMAIDAQLSLAARRLKQGKPAEAAAIFGPLESDPAEHVRMGVLSGMVAAVPGEAPGRLMRALGGENPRLRGLAAELVEHTRDQAVVDAVAASLGQLPAPGQEALLEAFGRRGDPAVRPAVLEALTRPDPRVRAAALRTLGVVGRAEDVPWLTRAALSAAARAERVAALESLRRLSDPGTDAAILARLSQVRAPEEDVRVLIRLLEARGAKSAVPWLLQAAEGAEEAVRLAALHALQTLADHPSAEALVRILSKPPRGEEREAAERAVLLACLKNPDPARRADPILAALRTATPAGRSALLPALGGLGGARALELVHAARKDPHELVQLAAVQALANWPDASVAPELLEIAKTSPVAAQRAAAVRGLARVAPRPGHLPPPQAFSYLRQAMELAEQPADKRYALLRMAPVRVPECLAYVLSCLGNPELHDQALAAAAELAEGMKESHPKEARAALEKILALTKDEKLRAHVDRLLVRMKWKGT